MFVSVVPLFNVNNAILLQIFVLYVNLSTGLILLPAAQDVMILIAGIVKPII